MTDSAAAVYVSYRTAKLDLSWIPDTAEVIVVHNDDSLNPASVRHADVRHLRGGGNVGFGAAVNAALAHVRSRRVILCNPDTELRAEHWDALSDGDANDIITIPLHDAHGRPTSAVNRYPTPLSLMLTGYRVGRFAPRGSRLRTMVAPILGAWGRQHAASIQISSGTWALRDYWVSAAVISVDSDRLRAVHGFNTEYFLYFEDVDLCRRLATTYPTMCIRMPDTLPGMHAVGGSATATAPLVERLRLASARRYARSQDGIGWRLCALALVPRNALLQRRRSAA